MLDLDLISFKRGGFGFGFERFEKSGFGFEGSTGFGFGFEVALICPPLFQKENKKRIKCLPLLEAK